MASTYLSRTSGTTTNNKIGTFSFWVKFSKKTETSSYEPHIFDSYYSSDNRSGLKFENQKLLFYSRVGASTQVNVSTNRLFRDTNAWYHIVIAIDMTQATNTNRLKFYVNGVQETSMDATTYGSQNDTIHHFLGSVNLAIGRYGGNTSVNHIFDGILSHVHYIDGTAYSASDFGETDSTTGEWKIKTSPSVTYGNNGFFILKDGNSVTDSSSNSNDFSVTAGTLTKTEDCPSNVFCTVNPLARYSANLNITNGNTTVDETGNGWQMASSTLGASTGKWYLEYKITTAGNANGYHKIGFISDEAFSSSASHIAESALDGGYAFYCSNGSLEVRTNDAVISGYSKSDLGVNLTTGSVMCLAIDMDNKRAYFRKNADAWIKSADPVNGTNGLDISADYTTGKAMIPAIAIYQGGAGSINFGNGYFGQSAVSSAGTNASGNGIFEYDVPTGYTALSTKGLNL
jgi:hypothetical protein